MSCIMFISLPIVGTFSCSSVSLMGRWIQQQMSNLKKWKTFGTWEGYWTLHGIACRFELVTRICRPSTRKEIIDLSEAAAFLCATLTDLMLSMCQVIKMLLACTSWCLDLRGLLKLFLIMQSVICLEYFSFCWSSLSYGHGVLTLKMDIPMAEINPRIRSE